MWKLQLILFCGLLFGAAVIRSAETGNHAWSYEDGKESERPASWGNHYPMCNGQNQSPINLVSSEAKFSGVLQMNALKLHGYEDDSISQSLVHLYNNGHTARISVADPSKKAIGIYGGGLPHHYVLNQFHWHWGSSDDRGSEHTFNGKAYPAEIHFVHVNSWYLDEPEKILSEPDGLAVIGVFMEVGERNPDFDPIVELFEHASKEGTNETSVRLNLQNLMGFLPKDFSKFYRYQGSLTTPPCNEAVIWTVMRDPIQISAAQLEKFRTFLLKDKTVAGNQTPSSSTNVIVDNYRPVQPLNGRKVYASFTDKTIMELPDLRDHKWSYDGAHGSPSPEKWGDKYEKCHGRKQSPIYITHSEAIPSAFIAGQPWVLENYDKLPSTFQAFLQNNGHTVAAVVTDGVSVAGGGLPATFRLAQFHLHWGSADEKGSEHVLNGKQYAAELHMVHFNNFYKSTDQIVQNQDGIAVLGVLIEVGEHNTAFDPIINKLKHLEYITEADTDIELELQSLRQFLPDDISEFYRYHGSLTTPPCHEAVMWTVFKKPVTISQAQLNSFRTQLYNMMPPNSTNIVSETSDGNFNTNNNDGSHKTEGDTHGGDNGGSKVQSLVIDNYRPVQKLYDRVVKYAKIQPQGNDVSAARALVASSITSILALLFLKYFL